MIRPPILQGLNFDGIKFGVVAKEGSLLLQGQGLSGLVRDEIHYMNQNFLKIMTTVWEQLISWGNSK